VKRDLCNVSNITEFLPDPPVSVDRQCSWKSSPGFRQFLLGVSGENRQQRLSRPISDDVVPCQQGIGYFNPYPSKWGGVKWPSGHFCLCISETVRYTAMCFWDIVQDSEGYLLPYKVLSHLYRKWERDGMKSEVHFRKSAKSHMPDCKSHNYKQELLFHQLLSCFHGHLAWICCWHGFLMSIFIAICDPENVSCPWKFTDILVLSGYNNFRFWAWLLRHLSYLTLTCSTWCHFSFLMDT